MTTEWYYTTNKQQMGPVSWDELCQLAGSGLLKPSDMVWTDGMAEWVKAARQNGLFEGTAVTTPAAPRAVVEAPPPPRRSATRRRIDEEMDEERDDRRERRRPRKKGSNTGLKVFLIVGVIVLILAVLGCGLIGVLAIVFGGFGGGGGILGDRNYAISLAPGTQDERAFPFQAGQRVTVTVTTSRNFGPMQPDVDLFIIHRGNVIAFDTRVHPDCNVTFVAPANDNYIVRVKNLGPGRASSRVIVQ